MLSQAETFLSGASIQRRPERACCTNKFQELGAKSAFFGSQSISSEKSRTIQWANFSSRMWQHKQKSCQSIDTSENQTFGGSNTSQVTTNPSQYTLPLPWWRQIQFLYFNVSFKLPAVNINYFPVTSSSKCARNAMSAEFLFQCVTPGLVLPDCWDFHLFEGKSLGNCAPVIFSLNREIRGSILVSWISVSTSHLRFPR